MNEKLKENFKLFNTPLEVGLRTLVIMNDFREEYLDIERLMYFDYLSLNSSDVGGPESLSPPIPNRRLQVYARKELIRSGLVILLSKELIELTSSDQGFGYKITDAGTKFLSLFSTNYFFELVKRSNWLFLSFKGVGLFELRNYIEINIPNWGTDLIEPQTE